MEKTNLKNDLLERANSIGNVILTAMNRERNAEYLKEALHINYLDLALVFKCVINMNEEGIGTILISNDMLNKDISKEDLLSIAIENTKKILGISIRPIREILLETFVRQGMPIEIADIFIEDTELPMYVITNNLGINGAVLLYFKDVLKDLADELDSDLWILPSSIHEILAVPVNEVGQAMDLKEMVKSVNTEQVSENEQLSDNIYLYSRDTNTVSFI